MLFRSRNKCIYFSPPTLLKKHFLNFFLSLFPHTYCCLLYTSRKHLGSKKDALSGMTLWTRCEFSFIQFHPCLCRVHLDMKQMCIRDRYYAAIVIPKDFSSSLLSILSGNLKTPELDYYINEKVNAIAPKITSSEIGRAHV